MLWYDLPMGDTYDTRDIRARQLELMELVVPAFAPAYPQADAEHMHGILAVPRPAWDAFMEEWADRKPNIATGLEHINRARHTDFTLNAQADRALEQLAEDYMQTIYWRTLSQNIRYDDMKAAIREGDVQHAIDHAEAANEKRLAVVESVQARIAQLYITRFQEPQFDMSAEASLAVVGQAIRQLLQMPVPGIGAVAAVDPSVQKLSPRTAVEEVHRHALVTDIAAVRVMGGSKLS